MDGALYLLTAGGAAEPLFRDPQDYDTYLKLLAEHKARYGFQLFAYCLLPESLSLCLEPRPGTTVSAIMHDLTAAYTRYVNKRYGRSGPLVRERFKETVVEKTPYLLSLTAHVHSLPRQAGLVQALPGYPFSSCRRYCSQEASTDRLEMDAEIGEVVSLLPAAQATYEQYLNDLSTEDLERLARTFRQRIVGSETFINNLMRERRTCRQVAAVSDTASDPRIAEAGTDGSAAPVVAQRPAAAPSRHLALAMVSVLAVMFSGGVVASLHQRIGALQETIAALSEENEASFRTRPSLAIQREAIGELASLEGTEWDVRLMPMHAQGAEAIQQDRLAFTKRQVSATSLASQGFSAANYTMTVQPDGTRNWETMQSNPSGELVSWQGEWQGPVMRGLVTRQTATKTSEQFTFVAVARKPATLRSET